MITDAIYIEAQYLQRLVYILLSYYRLVYVGKHALTALHHIKAKEISKGLVILPFISH